MQTQKWIGVVPEQVNQFKRWAVDNHDTVSVKQDSPDGSETGTVSGHKYIFQLGLRLQVRCGRGNRHGQRRKPRRRHF